MIAPARLRVRPRAIQSRHLLPIVSPSSFRYYSSLFAAYKSSNSHKRISLTPSSHLILPRTQNRTLTILPLLDQAVTLAHTTLTTLHTATGTPWYLTIPLFSLSINLLTRLPATLYSHQLTIRRAKLIPLLRAWGAAVGRVLASNPPPATQGVMLKREAFMVRYAKMVRQVEKEVYQRWGVQGWRFWVPSLAVFPVWLVGIEALRRMCGGPRGLVGSLILGFGREEAGVAGAAAGSTATTAESAATASRNAVDAAVTADPSTLIPWADPTMTTEGALWFTNLTVADPYHILPLALSAVLIGNMLPRNTSGLRTLFHTNLTPSEQSSLTGPAGRALRWRLRLRRTLLVFAAAVGPLTMDLPAALHLYWLSSAALTWAETSLLAWWRPIPKAPSPARKDTAVVVRPLRDGRVMVE